MSATKTDQGQQNKQDPQHQNKQDPQHRQESSHDQRGSHNPGNDPGNKGQNQKREEEQRNQNFSVSGSELFHSLAETLPAIVQRDTKRSRECPRECHRGHCEIHRQTSAGPPHAGRDLYGGAAAAGQHASPSGTGASIRSAAPAENTVRPIQTDPHTNSGKLRLRAGASQPAEKSTLHLTCSWGAL